MSVINFVVIYRLLDLAIPDYARMATIRLWKEKDFTGERTPTRDCITATMADNSDEQTSLEISLGNVCLYGQK
jgi:hypothetical protein